MPIDGLGIDDDGVTYQAVPLKQASAAEQLRVSIAMAMALNPTLALAAARQHAGPMAADGYGEGS